MRRRLRRVVKWTGAVFTVLLIVLWIGSAWWWWGVESRSETSYCDIHILKGRIFASSEHSELQDPAAVTGAQVVPLSQLMEPGLYLSFFWDRWITPNYQSTRGAIPIWSLVLLIAVPTAWMFRTDWKRRRGEREGLCPKCGHDLRANLSAGCPECGWNREESAT